MRRVLSLGLSLILSTTFLTCGGSNKPLSFRNNEDNSSNSTSQSTSQKNRAPEFLSNLTDNVTAARDNQGNYVIPARTYAWFNWMARDYDGDQIYYTISETGGTKSGSFDRRHGESTKWINTVKWTAPSSVPEKEKHTIKLRIYDLKGGEDIARVDVYVTPGFNY